MLTASTTFSLSPMAPPWSTAEHATTWLGELRSLLVTEAVRAAPEGSGRRLSRALRTANGIGGMSTPLAHELLTLFISGVPSRPR